jgi:cyclophilin family peptidyl-prolyl cis-trans isomerase
MPISSFERAANVYRHAVLPLLTAALLTGCGGGGGDTHTPATMRVTSASTDTPLYGQSLHITVQGELLDQGLTPVSTACKTITQAPSTSFASSSTTIHYLCAVQAVGSQTMELRRSDTGAALQTLNFTVPLPQVTMAVGNGVGVNGDIVFTLRPDLAPITTDNFLAYVRSGFYDNTVFHRVQTNFVVQGGGYASPVVAGTVPAHKATSAAITLEAGNGLSNVLWSVAMARTSVANSATSEFFINLRDNASNLDKTATNAGYAVFASVTAGTDVVSAMTVAPCQTITGFISSALGCVPIPNVVISTARQTR